jgi:hypothetical protein
MDPQKLRELIRQHRQAIRTSRRKLMQYKGTMFGGRTNLLHLSQTGRAAAYGTALTQAVMQIIKKTTPRDLVKLVTMARRK